MIPKVIHYSWFSDEPFPKHISDFIDGWKELMPDYEYVLWDGRKLLELNNNFANQAVSVQKWAFAADFLRFYVVYHYGGIWFDTDIQVFKSFTPLLKNSMFVSREAGVHGYGAKERWLTAHCFGAEKGHPYIKDCLDFYLDRSFIRTSNEKFPMELQYDMIISPEIMSVVAKNYGYNDNGFIDKKEVIDHGICIYPSDFLDSPQYKSMKRVYSIHRESGSWRADNQGKGLNFKGTNPKKGRIINAIKLILQKIMLKFNIALIRVR
jgi:mannosyltransferase OCH1-like enzyme